MRLRFAQEIAWLLLALAAHAGAPARAASVPDEPGEPGEDAAVVAADDGPAEATYKRYRDMSAPATGEYADERKRLDRRYYGSFQVERQRMQDGIIDRLVEGGKVPDRPRLIFMAGAMASGKTEAVVPRLRDAGYYDPNEFVLLDPDDIKTMLPEYEGLQRSKPLEAASLVHRESTYLRDVALERALASGKNIVVDGSLRDTQFYRDLLIRIRKMYPWYLVEIVHVKTGEETVRRRMADRAAKTQRFVPEDVLVASVRDSENTVRALERSVDRVLTVRNDGRPALVRVTTSNRTGAGTLTEILMIPLDRAERARSAVASFMRPLPPSASESQFKHVVYDLDWTIISPVKSAEGLDPSRVLKIDGELYYVSPGAAEAITAQANDPRLRVSFFSGGSPTRNLKALQAIRLADGSGRTLYDIAYRIQSKGDLTPMKGLSESARFSERFKKDLTKIFGDLSNVILVDDIRDFALPGQTVLHLGDTYHPSESYEASQLARALAEDPRYHAPPGADGLKERAWFEERHKIAAVFAIVREALDRPLPGEPFARAVARLAAQARGPHVARGLRALGLAEAEHPVCLREVARMMGGR